MNVEELAKQIVSAEIDDVEEMVALLARKIAQEAVACCYRVHRTRGTPPDCARAITEKLLGPARE